MNLFLAMELLIALQFSLGIRGLGLGKRQNPSDNENWLTHNLTQYLRKLRISKNSLPQYNVDQKNIQHRC